MRSEAEMLDLILGIARADDRIRAVIMNGSRTNPNAPRDPFQDYDIVYLVKDVAPFRRNLAWITRFGELMIVQTPDDMGDAPAPTYSYSYLMQFMDGNRIDLTLYPLDRLAELTRDSLSRLLLDKDGLVTPFPPPSDRDYLPRPPTAQQFSDCCNEFWWVSTYVAKGLWREEITYAKAMHDQVVRVELLKMLTWWVGVETNFAYSVGKEGKYLHRWLAPELWRQLLATYADADVARSWEALFATCALFRRVARPVAAHFGYPYPQEDDARVSAYLAHVRNLPRHAQSIY
ncbi:MAG TPA: aminoglycoside 6-adenylyltransferase [Chloroflexi bacterium]|nr:aminoglycoside 6-adenylyltransferase [Chloroflexota bacterium]